MKIIGIAEVTIDAVDVEQAMLRDMAEKPSPLIYIDAAMAKEETVKLHRLLLKYKHTLEYSHAFIRKDGGALVLFIIRSTKTDNEKTAEECGL